MVEETDLQEYAASIATGTIELVAVVDAIKDALAAGLPNDEDCAVAIAGAKETRDALIRDTYRIGLVPFMQGEGGAEEPDDTESEDEAAEDDTKVGRGGR